MADDVKTLVPINLEERLTGQPALEALAAAMRSAAYVLTPDDQMVIADAARLEVRDGDDYKRGFEILDELEVIDKTALATNGRFAKPLKFLSDVVQSLTGPVKKQTAAVRAPLRERLGQWKLAADQRDREETRRKQEAADAAAKAAQQARASTLARVAEAESDPRLKESFKAEAAAVASVDVHAAPVETVSSVPKDAAGYVKTEWTCKFVDVKALVTAWVEGRIQFLPEDAIAAGLQKFMDGQAEQLQANLSKAFPGVEAVEVPIPVRRGRR